MALSSGIYKNYRKTNGHNVMDTYLKSSYTFVSVYFTFSYWIPLLVEVQEWLKFRHLECISLIFLRVGGECGSDSIMDLQRPVHHANQQRYLNSFRTDQF